MKIIFLVLLFLLVGCSKDNTLIQIKKDIVRMSTTLYVECDEKQQKNKIDLSSVPYQQLIYLDSLLETDESSILLLDIADQDANQVLARLKQLDEKAQFFQYKQNIVMVKGNDVNLVNRIINKLQ